MLGTTLNGRFSLDKELGRGGMGAVYRATDLVLQRSVAIKVLKDRSGPAVGRKIRLEAQILARLVHENIVRIYDFGESDGLYYFVMEEVDGTSFHRRSRQLDLAGKFRVIAQVADALDYAHQQGVIHRDVKPANVLLTKADSARLSDFGLSVLTEESHETTTIRGTPTYMSPEQAKAAKLDPRTDLYSLGVMLYEAAAGSPPFSGPTYSVIASHAGATPDTPRERNPAVSPAVEALILRLIEKSPAARPSTGAEVAASIRHLLATDPTLTGEAAPDAAPGAAAPAAAPRIAGQPTAATQVAAARQAPAAADERSEDARSAVQRMIAEIVAEPMTLAPEERYLVGHYLAYLLGGSRRRGFLRRRPLDPLNADRARLLVTMTWLMLRGATDGAVATAARVLDERPEVRPSVTPMVVAKYLSCRDSPGKRKVFRNVRRRLQEASAHAKERLTDSAGVLNPGLMPQVVSDLARIAPERTEVDDQLVERWNRVADLWRDRADFRRAVLGYATTSAADDPASAVLWPEVVYPLIERARWQRQLRSGPAVVIDQVLEVLRIPEPGNRLEQAIRKVVPRRVVESLDAEGHSFADEAVVEAFEDDQPAPSLADAPGQISMQVDETRFLEMTTDMARTKNLVRLISPDPIRLTLGELNELWKEGVASLHTGGTRAGNRHIPIGPYRLVVVPSIRGRSAGQVAIQGMQNKQIEMLTPSLRVSSPASRALIAVWFFADDSLAISYIDFRNVTRYVFWHAPAAHQTNYEDAAALGDELFQRGLEPPDSLGSALTKSYRPRSSKTV